MHSIKIARDDVSLKLKNPISQKKKKKKVKKSQISWVWDLI